MDIRRDRGLAWTIIAWIVAALCIGGGMYLAMAATNWLLGGTGLTL